MQINSLAIVNDLKGEAFTFEDKPATVRTLCVTALCAQYQDEGNLPGVDKMKRYRIAQKLSFQALPDLSAEDISIVKAVIAKGFPAGIVGAVYDLIDPPASDNQ